MNLLSFAKAKILLVCLASAFYTTSASTRQLFISNVEDDMIDTSGEDSHPLDRWWVRLCRRLWRQRSFVWITIILGLGLNVFATWLFTPWGTDFTKLPIGWAIKNPIIILLVGTCLLLLTGLVGVVSHLVESPSSHPTTVQQNRKRFLSILRIRYTEAIEQSLQGAALIALGLHKKFGATHNPARLVFRQSDHLERSLPSGTSILQAYDDAVGELLVLGEPGAGKTTLLLELASDLLERAEQDDTNSIPVIFNLSSWAVKQQPLSDWLVDELIHSYQVPRLLSQTWVQQNQIIPLLDGLDEVVSSARNACIDAINTYRQNHLVQLVVSSRSGEYLSQQHRLVLQSAIMIQPLTKQQVDEYLLQAGKPMTAVRAVLRTNPFLRELVTTPLMLSVLTLTYQGKSVKALPQMGSIEMQQRQVFVNYVERMFEHKGVDPRYSLEQTKHWLAWLAKQMKQRSQSVFYIEQLQPDWLQRSRECRIYEHLAVRFLGGLIGGLMSLVVVQLLFGVIMNSFAFICIIIGGFIGGMLSGRKKTTASTEFIMQSWRKLWHNLINLKHLRNGVLMGFLVGLSVVLVMMFGLMLSQKIQIDTGFMTAFDLTWNDFLILAPKFALSFGLSFVLVGILLSVLLDREKTRAVPTGVGRQPWRNLWHSLINLEHLRNGLFIGLLVGLGFWMSIGFGLYFPYLNIGLMAGLSYGLSFVLIGILLNMALEGKGSTIQPTEVVVWSWRNFLHSLINFRYLRNGLLIGLLVGLSIWLDVGLSLTYEGWLDFGVVLAVGYSLSIGLIYWVLMGLSRGLSSNSLDAHHRVIPNQGIRRSARNSILVGLISGFVCWFACNLNYGLIYEFRGGMSFVLNRGLGIEILIGLTSGILVGLLGGGLACIQHIILRILLWSTGVIPWNYPRFLDYAASRILVHKVGGGYIFVHRLLLDHFASLDTVSTTQQEAAQA